MSFEAATTRFSAVNAEALAVASTIAYEADNTKAQRRAKEELGLDQFFEPFEHHNFVIDTEGFVAASKQHVVLAFRGTEPSKIKDWATDALAAPSAFRWFFERAPDVGKIQLCLPTADRFRPILFVASASPFQTNPTQKPTMGVLKRNSHGNDVAKWQRLTKANSRPLGIRFKPG